MPSPSFMKKEKNITTEKLIKSADIEFVNKLIRKSEGLGDFEMSKSTLANIASWALNGASDTEIRKNLDLNKNQWAILCTVCPTMIIIMQHSRAMADMVVAGSLFQTAIGGKVIKKEQLIKVGDYEGGIKVGEHVEKHIVEEELPPNPVLLKFLAENKLSEQFGDKKNDKSDNLRQLVESLSPEDKALIEAARKSSSLDGTN